MAHHIHVLNGLMVGRVQPGAVWCMAQAARLFKAMGAGVMETFSVTSLNVRPSYRDTSSLFVIFFLKKSTRYLSQGSSWAVF